jgi:pyridoxamine 5'-phosphate oxidase
MSSATDLASLRKDYALAELDEAGVARDPFAQLDLWLKEAISGGCPEPTAMSLATVGAAARPSSRIVLLKGVEHGGLVFYTNYQSRKGIELAVNPQAALLFHWVELEREVRIEGRIEKVEPANSDAYYRSRPPKSRIGAWASPQSRPIDNRAWLEKSFTDAEARHGADPPRPPHWGGYRLLPDAFEFWQGRASRLHDRIAFSLVDGKWQVARLAP